MNPLAITAAPAQGGAFETMAPCAFDPIYTFLSFNFYNIILFLMARDGVTIISSTSIFFHSIEAGFDAGPHSYTSRLRTSPPGGPL